MSCKRIEIDLGAVGSERLELPEGTVMDIQHVMRSKSSTVYAYEVGVTYSTLPVLEYHLISEEYPKTIGFRPRMVPRLW